MMDILLFVHIVIAVLLISVILLQQTGSDGLSGLSGSGGGNMGLVSARSAANFLTRLTVILAVMFFVNAIILANLSGRQTRDISGKIQNAVVETMDTPVPIAK